MRCVYCPDAALGSFHSHPKWKHVGLIDVMTAVSMSCQCHVLYTRAENPGAEKKCAACKTQYYCDAGCQRVHWKAEHKTECKRFVEK